MQDLVWRSMVELGRMIATKEVSPVEVVRAFLERVTALDGTLKSFITVGADAALAAARGAEAELVAGRPAGPLHGVPYALKDLYNTKGVRTTGGSRILGDFVPTEDATVVSRLVGAGAIVLGKLNMHEFAYGPEGLNPHYGAPWDPWDKATHRICGGQAVRLRGGGGGWGCCGHFSWSPPPRRSNGRSRRRCRRSSGSAPPFKRSVWRRSSSLPPPPRPSSPPRPTPITSHGSSSGRGSTARTCRSGCGW